ncbi:aminotransferase class V-fold PLP-dependent enzyme [Ramlibacter sp.]|uniref:aminotransferase class V-fold PLP-dependent enzyme n=1 Tax=Ramlibacter sp. TaxID=1917967 RepID=UPI0025DF6583|nr:aminotransferase class V-fold PLP-dependent enzyme [Ramlibacter sp.]
MHTATSVPVKTEPPPPRLFEAAHDFDPMDWASVRGQFKLDPALAHLSNFYLCSYPKPVRDAIDFYRDALDRDPHSFLNDNMFARPEQALWRRVAETIARYTGGSFDEIALTGNTTLGLGLVYNGIALRPGQEILTTTHEFYPHYEAVRLAAERYGATLRQVSLYEDSARASVGEMVDRLVSAVGPQTRVLAVTWVHSNFGVVLPITAVSAALAAVNRDRAPEDQVLLVVDGVHGFGVLDEDVARMGCDFFAAGTHKWMLGPHGSGIVWGKAASWARIRPTIPSLMAREPANAWRESRTPAGPVQAAWVSPGGFLAYEHIWAIAEAFRFHERIGRARIAERILALNGALKDGLAQMSHVRLLSPRARELSAGFVCFDVEGIAPKEVALRLRQAGVIANATPYARSCARFSAGIVNSEADIERALAVVRAMR